MELTKKSNADGDYYLVQISEKIENDTLLAALQERTAKRIKDGDEPLKNDLLMIEAIKGGKNPPIRFSKNTLTTSFVAPLNAFYARTREMVAKIVETKPPFNDDTFLERYKLGQMASQMVLELTTLAEISELDTTDVEDPAS